MTPVTVLLGVVLFPGLHHLLCRVFTQTQCLSFPAPYKANFVVYSNSNLKIDALSFSLPAEMAEGNSSRAPWVWLFSAT